MSIVNTCLWCGKKEKDVERLFRGPAVCICDQCVKSMSGEARDECSTLAEEVRREIDKAVQDGFKNITQLNLGPLQEKYQRLMRVKFKEESGSPTFNEVFMEFKKGVEAEIALDDYQTRYDLGIAYHEMGLTDDALREMLRSLGGALRQKDYVRAGEIVSALLFFHEDTAQAIRAIYKTMCETGIE